MNRVCRISLISALAAFLCACPSAPPTPSFSEGFSYDIAVDETGGHIFFFDPTDFVVVGEARAAEGEDRTYAIFRDDVNTVKKEPTWSRIFDEFYALSYSNRQNTAAAQADSNLVCIAGMNDRARAALENPGRLRVVLLDESGDAVWDYVYFDDVPLHPDSVVAFDDGLRIVGMEENEFGMPARPFVLKLDYAGNVVWISIPELAEGEQPLRVMDSVAAPGGGVAMSGRFQGGDQGLRLLDANGAVVWTREYPYPASAYALGAMPDGGFVMAADRNADGDEDIVLTRTGANGDILWVLEDATAGFETHARTNPIDLIVDSAGNILLTAEGRTVRYVSTFPFTSTDYFLASYSPSGEPQWLTMLPDGYRGIGLAERPGGGYATTGSHDGMVRAI